MEGGVSMLSFVVLLSMLAGFVHLLFLGLFDLFAIADMAFILRHPFLSV